MKMKKLLPLLAAACCSFVAVGAIAAIPPRYDVPVETASAATKTIMLNDCELAANGAFEVSGATIETSTEHVVQGSRSVKMVTSAGYAPTLIFLKQNGAPLTREDLLQLDYIEVTIFSDTGMDFFFYNHNMGWLFANQSTTLRISGADFLAQVDGGNKGTSFDPYSYSMGYAFFQVPIAGATLYFDNIIGVKTVPDSVSPLFNSCDVVDDSWVQTNGSYTIESTLMSEGNASIRLNLAADNYFQLYLRNADDNNAVLTTEQLLSFDYLAVDINNNTGNNVNIYLSNSLVATIAPGWNTVAIPASKIQSEINQNAGQFTDGKFLFKVDTNCTLLVDNVRGMSQAELNESYQDFSGINFSAATAGDPINVEYGSDTVSVLSATQASAAGLPSGYTGNVMSIANSTNANGKGVLVDFSALKLAASLVESVTFRVYFPDDTASNGYPKVRIRNQADTDFAVDFSVEAHAGGWYDFVLGADTFKGSYNFSHLSTNGYLDKFEFALRTGNTAPFYIDSISYRLTTDPDDTDIPVISYGGPDTVYFLAEAGRQFTLDVTAYDRTQGQINDIRCLWDNPYAVNPDGSLNPGSYVLTMEVADVAGNKATKTVNVVAVARENNAPVITIPSTSISLPVGTKPQLLPQVTDDSGIPATVTTAWSNGALNKKGQLNEGTHTCTITATDLSGNIATATITVTAMSGNLDNWGDIVDETVPVTLSYNANGGTGSTVSTVYAKGTKITLENCMFVAPANSAFAAWAIGSASGTKVQPGDTITLSGDTTIYAVWEQNHVHSFEGNWQKDENGHWKDCVCGASDTALPHNDSNKDHSCDDCGYKVSDHDFNSNWQKDDTHHWKQCDCGEKQDYAEHADVTTDKDHNCDVCGNKAGDHNFASTWETNDTHHWKQCDCGEKQDYAEHADVTTDKDHNCDTCEKVVGDHTYDSVWQKDENGHWKDCVCGASDTAIPHNDDNKDHACDDCGYSTGSCSDSATDSDHLCDFCGKPFGTHVYDGALQKDETGHWNACNCGDKGTISSHTDNNTDHLCDVCGYVAGECNDSATDNDHNCDFCGKPLGNHAFDEAWQVGEDTHWKQCNCGAKDSEASHFDATTDHDHNCDACGRQLDEHTPIGDWQLGTSHHWKVCDCGAKVGYSNHFDSTTDDDHLCDDCGIKLNDCLDADHDHFCDICVAKTSDCVDSDSDNTCDVCDKDLSTTETPSDNENGNDAPNDGGKKGCKGSIGGATLLIPIATALFLGLKKRKED